MSIELINIWYIVAAALFIFGLKQLGSPATAVRGNRLSSIAMLIAIVVTLFNAQILSFQWILIAAAIGAIIGAIAARKVAMTSMPEMVALFNGSGGIASLLVGWAALYNVGNTLFTDITIVLSIIIGGVVAIMVGVCFLSLICILVDCFFIGLNVDWVTSFESDFFSSSSELLLFLSADSFYLTSLKRPIKFGSNLLNVSMKVFCLGGVAFLDF